MYGLCWWPLKADVCVSQGLYYNVSGVPAAPHMLGSVPLCNNNPLPMGEVISSVPMGDDVTQNSFLQIEMVRVGSPPSHYTEEPQNTEQHVSELQLEPTPVVSLSSLLLSTVLLKHLKSLLLPKAAFIWSKSSKNTNIVKCYYNFKSFYIEYILKYNLFLWCKAEFSASLLRSSVSHDPSEIILKCWFAAQETFIKTVVLLYIFVETMIHFSGLFRWIESSIEQHLFEI